MLADEARDLRKLYNLLWLRRIVLCNLGGLSVLNFKVAGFVDPNL